MSAEDGRGAPRSESDSGVVAGAFCRIGVTVHDLLFVLAILAVFGVLALIAAGAEKL